MSEALIPIQREDGFWNVSLHDSTEYGGKETSGTAFFVFGLAWGVNNGLLTDPVYKNAAVKGWNGMVNYALHVNGFRPTVSLLLMIKCRTLKITAWELFCWLEVKFIN